MSGGRELANTLECRPPESHVTGHINDNLNDTNNSDVKKDEENEAHQCPDRANRKRIMTAITSLSLLFSPHGRIVNVDLVFFTQRENPSI